MKPIIPEHLALAIKHSRIFLPFDFTRNTTLDHLTASYEETIDRAESDSHLSLK